MVPKLPIISKYSSNKSCFEAFFVIIANFGSVHKVDILILVHCHISETQIFGTPSSTPVEDRQMHQLTFL